MGTERRRGFVRLFSIFTILITLSLAGCFDSNDGNASSQGDQDDVNGEMNGEADGVDGNVPWQGDQDESVGEMNGEADGIEDAGDEVEDENDVVDVDDNDRVDDSEDGDIDQEFEIPEGIYNEPCLKVREAMEEECDPTDLYYCMISFHNRDGNFLSAYYDDDCDGVADYPDSPDYENIYDENGRLIRNMVQLDYDLGIHEFEYDSQGRVILIRSYRDSDRDDQYECEFEYNGNGKLISTCSHDSIEYDEEAGTVTYGCYSMRLDESGNAVYRESTCSSDYGEQGCRTSEYDSENRLTSCIYPDLCGNEENGYIYGYDTFFTYDESGRLKTADNETTGDECLCDEYFYDEFGNPTYINGSCPRCSENWAMPCYAYDNDYLCDGIVPVRKVSAECDDLFSDSQPFPWMGIYH